MSNEKTLNSILKSLKAINARLGTVATASLSADVAAAITDEAAVNVVLDTATAGEATSNAILDTAVTDEAAVNTAVDAAQIAVGTPAGGDSVAEQIVALKIQVQANHG
jgi:hypothetical protein